SSAMSSNPHPNADGSATFISGPGGKLRRSGSFSDFTFISPSPDDDINNPKSPPFSPTINSSSSSRSRGSVSRGSATPSATTSSSSSHRHGSIRRKPEVRADPENWSFLPVGRDELKEHFINSSNNN